MNAKPTGSILVEAEHLINGPRQSVYAHPFDNFTQTAALWSPILGVEVTPEQVALCMIQVKISRLCNTPDHRDSIVDIAGYAGTYEKVQERRAERIEDAKPAGKTRGEIMHDIVRANPWAIPGELPVAPEPRFGDKAEPGPIVPLAPSATNHPLTDVRPDVLEDEKE